jgi:flagellar biosynthetic protein FliR
MSQMTLSQLVHDLGGGTQVTGFFLVLARISPMFVLAPLFSSKMVPARVRGIVAVALAIGLTGVAMHGQHVPGQLLPVAGLLIEQVLIGTVFAFAVAAVFAAVQAAGGLLDITSGFSFGATVDPINGNQGGVLTQFYSLVGVVLFLAIGGDAWMLRGLTRTFTLVPLTKGPQLDSLVSGAEVAFGSIFLSALEVAAPVMLALLITDVAFGMVSRVVPQLNVFAVAFPLKVGVALLVVGASLPFIAGWMSDQVATSVYTALQSLHVA